MNFNPFLFPFFFDLLFFHYFGQGHSQFVLAIIFFFVIWACPLAFEFLGSFASFGFLMAF